jgi:uncharacterized protein (DUF58 family)
MSARSAGARLVRRAPEPVQRAVRMLRRTPFPVPTTRGWCVVATGIGLVGGGLVATTSVAVTGGLLLLVLVVLGMAVAYGTAAPLSGTRRTGRTIVQVGEVFRESVEIRGRMVGFGTVRLLVRERLEDNFAGFTDDAVLVEIGPGRPPARLDFEAIAVRRGHTLVGPLTVRAEDPFGLLRVDRPVVRAEEVVVVPRSSTVGAIDTGALAGAVSAEEGRVGQGGSADDSELRPYRPGDPIRRVHWAQSARRGELHVRQTTQAQPPEAVIALDLRRSAYQDLGRDDLAELADLGGDQAFEHAVVVAAGVARLLAARTSRVRLVTDRGDDDDRRGDAARGLAAPARRAEAFRRRDSTARTAADPDDSDLLDVLVELADVRPRSDAQPLPEVLPQRDARVRQSMTAVVTGHCTPEEAAELVAHGSAAARGLFVSIVPPNATVRGILDRAGWRILVVPVPTSLPATLPTGLSGRRARSTPRTPGGSR